MKRNLFILLSLLACNNNETEIKNEVNIYKGTLTSQNQFKFSQDIYRKRTGPTGVKYKQICGITLIHKRIGITAAHCVGVDAVSINQTAQPQDYLRVRINGTLPLDKDTILTNLPQWKEKVKAQAENDYQTLSRVAGDAFVAFEKEKRDKLFENIEKPKQLNLAQLQYISGVMVEEKGVAVEKLKAYDGFGDVNKTNLQVSDLALVLLEEHNYPTTTVNLTNTVVTDKDKLYISGFGASDEADLEITSNNEPYLPFPQRWS